MAAVNYRDAANGEEYQLAYRGELYNEWDSIHNVTSQTDRPTLIQ